MQKEENDFWSLAHQSQTLKLILNHSAELGIPNWHIGAGFLAQTIWNLKSGFPENQFINDVDWVYFNSDDLSKEGEEKVELLVRDCFKDIPLKFDIKNQARVHLWYKEKFGHRIPPYDSIYAAIETYPTTATSIGITISKGKPQVFAPFGLSDVLTMTVRPNKKLITESIYLAKVERWKRHWPELKVISWIES